MNIADAERYLERNGETLLAGGSSGAKVFDIAGKYVFKRVRRAELKNGELYGSYRREAFWYESTMGKGTGFCLPFLPEILDVCYTDEEIAILMKRYRAVPRENIDEELLEKIMKTLAAVHTTTIPGFLKKGQQDNPEPHLFSDEEIQTFLSGWRSVLAEHPGVFDEAPLAGIAENINNIILWAAKESKVLSHGDFHWDNLLLDEQGNLLICDWQGVSVGAASGDLSFLFSRLGADGIHLDEKQAVHFYAQEIKRISGKTLDEEKIFRYMDAADVLTSFVFWHEYLHGNDVERVRGIYGKMTGLRPIPFQSHTSATESRGQSVSGRGIQTKRCSIASADDDCE